MVTLLLFPTNNNSIIEIILLPSKYEDGAEEHTKADYNRKFQECTHVSNDYSHYIALCIQQW